MPCVLEKLLPLASECSVIVARGHDGHMVHLPPQLNLHRDGILAVTEAYPDSVPAGRGAPGGRRGHGHRRRAGATSACCASSSSCCATARWWSTRWRRGRTTAATTASTPAMYRSSSCRCARSPVCRCPRRASTARPSCSTCWASCGSREATPKARRPGTGCWRLPGAHLHLYGKLSARKGRKMGHLTITGADGGGGARYRDEGCRVCWASRRSEAGLPMILAGASSAAIEQAAQRAGRR